MERTKAMDRLSRTIRAADAAGMSYGKYVAAYGVAPEKAIIDPNVPTRICKECGEPFSMVGRSPNSLYCSPTCQRSHSMRIYMKRYYERKEKNNGK